MNTTRQPLDETNNFKTLRTKRLQLPLKDMRRRSATTSRPLCDSSTDRQIKLSERLLPLSVVKPIAKSRKFYDLQKNYLQQWINNELQDQQTQGQGQLKAIRKYQIDRKSLLNMQISSQEIDKLYQSLYVYSHGVKNAFNELIGKNEQLMIKFWRVYMLLLEEKNVSTIVQKRHQQSLNIMVQTLKNTQKEVLNLKKDKKQRQKHLVKEISQKQDQIRKLKQQKEILQSNLLLTDEAFNQEVSRRLKFQQKINQINTIHNELKSKHIRLVQELQIYRQIDSQSRQTKRSLQSSQRELEVKITQLQKEIVQLKSDLRQSEQQCAKTKTQIHSLKHEQLKSIRDDQKEYFQLKDVLIRQKKYKLQMQNQIDAREKTDILMQQKTKQINRMARQIDQCRIVSEQERKRRLILDESINNLNKKIYEKEQKLQQVTHQNYLLVEAQKNYNKQIKQLTQSVTMEKNLSIFQKRTIASLETNTATMNKMIDQLKVSNLKYQTLYQGLTLQNAQLLQIVKNHKNQEYILRESNRELTVKLVEKQSIETSKQISMKNEIEINKQKIKSLTTQLNNKQKINSDISGKINKLRQSVVQKDYKFEQLKQSFIDLERTLNLQLIDKRSLQSRMGIKEQQLLKMKSDLKELINEVLGLKAQDTQLTKKNSELMIVQEFNEKTKDVELQILWRMINNYRKQIKSNNDHIHPMDYWDLQSQFLRLQEKYDKLITNMNKAKDDILKLNSELVLKSQQFQSQTKKLKSNNQKTSDTLTKLLSQKTAQIKQIQQQKIAYQKKYKKIQSQNGTLTEQIKVVSQKYNYIISKQRMNDETQTQNIFPTQHKESQTDQVKQEKQAQIKQQQIKQIQTRSIVQMIDKGVDTFQLMQEIGIFTPQSSKTSKQPSKEDQKSKQIKHPQKEQIFNIQDDYSSISKKKDNIVLKPVSKDEFSRAMKITLMRR